MCYTDAPATKMLATHCLICRRPLLDAASVEAGIGPVCREKSGYGEDIGGDREIANELIHRAAILAHDGKHEQVLDICNELRKMGFSELPSSIERGFLNCVPVQIVEEQGCFVVSAPYKREATQEWRNVGRWDAERKTRIVPISNKAALYALLRRHYRGIRAHGSKGCFTI